MGTVELVTVTVLCRTCGTEVDFGPEELPLRVEDEYCDLHYDEGAD